MLAQEVDGPDRAGADRKREWGPSGVQEARRRWGCVVRQVLATNGGSMARAKGKTEHAGAKNGGGAMWGKRAEVKDDSNKRRRAAAKDMIAAQIFEAQETIKANMTKQRTTDDIARMSGNDTVARMID